MSKRLDALRKRLLQIDADVAAGRISANDAAQAKARLEREVLDAVLHGKAAAAPPAVSPTTAAPKPAAPAPAAHEAADPWSGARPSRGLIGAVSAFVLLFAVAGYAWLGERAGWQIAPGVVAAPTAGAHTAAGIEPGQLEPMIAKLAQRLKETPDDAQGWSLLGRSYAVLGRHAESAAAMKKALDLKPDDAQALVDYADALGMANGGTLEGEPERLIAKALAIDANNAEALALAGTIAFRKADYALALRHWEKVVAQAEPQSELATQLQAGIDEARERAGLPSGPRGTPNAASPAGPSAAATAAAPSTAATAATAAPSTSATAAAANGGVVSGRVTLSAALRDKASPDDTVFVFARAAEGSRMPLAILRKQVKDLPLQFRLDDSMAMTPAARLSGAARVVVGARISKSGGATPQPGDLQGLSAPVAPGSTEAAALAIEISQPVP